MQLILILLIQEVLNKNVSVKLSLLKAKSGFYEKVLKLVILCSNIVGVVAPALNNVSKCTQDFFVCDLCQFNHSFSGS